MADERFDPDLLDEQDPFEIDARAGHLFKHPHLGIEDIEYLWTNDPLFYPAEPPAYWLMCAEVSGRVLVAPLAPRAAGIRAAAVRSAVTKRRQHWPSNTGGTDDQEEADDP